MLLTAWKARIYRNIWHKFTELWMTWRSRLRHTCSFFLLIPEQWVSRKVQSKQKDGILDTAHYWVNCCRMLRVLKFYMHFKNKWKIHDRSLIIDLQNFISCSDCYANNIFQKVLWHIFPVLLFLEHALFVYCWRQDTRIDELLG